MKTIVIDAGHGVPDPGAVGPGGLHEADVNLNVSLALAAFLRQDPKFKIILTRTGADAPYLKPASGKALTPAQIRKLSLRERVQIGIRENADLFVSIHCNGHADRSAHGYEVYCNNRGILPADKILTAMRRRLKSHTCRDDVPILKSYAVLKTRIPAALVELEFISNPEQELIFRDPTPRQFYAETIALGIQDYFA